MPESMSGDGAVTLRRLEGKKIALGVCGSIAAFKSVELLRLLQEEGAQVRCLVTYSGSRFVSTLTLATMSGNPVESDPLALLDDGRIGHIVAAQESDAILVAPATAHWLAAMAAGLAGDVVTATCLAATCPVVVAPAMDAGMYDHPATRGNVERLRSYGYGIVEPVEGRLASGAVGRGRLAPLPAIVDALVAALAPERHDLEGRRIVITAGGTAEPIDPVRFIGNRSSGKMGVAIAQAALDRGAEVVLIAGHVSVDLPARAHVIRAETAELMQEALRTTLADPLDGARTPDALVMAAAVADFRPKRAADRKLSRSDALTLELSPTPDLLAGTSKRMRDLAEQAATHGTPWRAPLLVGFAAETGSLARAPEKLRAKGVDLLVANDVASPGSGFGSETNAVTLLDRDGGAEAWPLMSKRAVADRLLDRMAALMDERDAGAALRERAFPRSPADLPPEEAGTATSPSKERP